LLKKQARYPGFWRKMQGLRGKLLHRLTLARPAGQPLLVGLCFAVHYIDAVSKNHFMLEFDPTLREGT
jgi:hypothetical protein